MSVLNTLPVPVVQMGLVEKMVEVEQNHPLVQQSVTQEAALHELKKQNSQVPQADRADPGGRKIRDREGKRERGRHTADNRQHAAAEESTEDGDTPDTPQRGGNPWAGQIVNVKI